MYQVKEHALGNVKSLKNIKNNLYSVKKDSDSIQIDLKKLKEEFVNNVNKRVKIRSINTTEIKTNKASSKKSNATCTIKYCDIVDASTSTNDLIVKNNVDVCTSTDDVCTSTDDVCTNENEPYANENEPCTNDDEYEYEYDDEDEDEDDEDDEDDDGSNDKPGNNDNKPGNNGNKHCNKDNNDNKPGKNDKKDHKQGNKDKDNKPVNNDNKESRQTNFAFSLRKLFLNNITKIIKLIEELNDEIYDDDQWLVFAKLNKINPLVDELIDRVWLMIYNKKREKNEIINISVDKVKDIEGYVKTYNEIVADKLKFVNGISELFDNVIEKKEFRNLKDDVLKLIGNSHICDVKRKDCKRDNKEKNSDVKRKAVRKIVMIAKKLIIMMMIMII